MNLEIEVPQGIFTMNSWPWLMGSKEEDDKVVFQVM